MLNITTVSLSDAILTEYASTGFQVDDRTRYQAYERLVTIGALAPTSFENFFSMLADKQTRLKASGLCPADVSTFRATFDAAQRGVEAQKGAYVAELLAALDLSDAAHAVMLELRKQLIATHFVSETEKVVREINQTIEKFASMREEPGALSVASMLRFLLEDFHERIRVFGMMRREEDAEVQAVTT